MVIARWPKLAGHVKEIAMAKLYFYYEALNAAKSTNLLQSAHR